MNTGHTAVPELTADIIAAVVADAAELCSRVVAVGLVGSYARDEQCRCSDVDLLVRVDGTGSFGEVLNGFGEYVRHVLDYQFNKRLDLIRYDLATDRAGREPQEGEPWFCREGFRRMLNEVKWLYER